MIASYRLRRNPVYDFKNIGICHFPLLHNSASVISILLTVSLLSIKSMSTPDDFISCLSPFVPICCKF